MANPDRRFLHRVLLCCLLLLYWTISLHNLTIVPRVYEDEPWQASTGWKLATDGLFGSDLFAGFYGMDQRYYGYLPLHPFVLAVLFRFTGVGLFQARFATVALGLLTLALTYRLAQRLFKDARVGVLAVLFLISVRLTGLTPSQLTGILFLDMARISRYDMLVPVFGLAALHVYLTARERGRARWYVLTGMLAGLAGLSHLYGVFYLPVLLALITWNKSDQSRTHIIDVESGSSETTQRPPRLGGETPRALAIAAALLGFSLTWLPYLVYVLGDIYDWQGQTRGYGDRFDLLNPGWYLQNLLREPHRYGPGLGPIGPGWLLRIGLWSTLIVLPLSLIALARRAWRQRDRSAQAVVVPAVLLPTLFAFLIRLKLVNYTLAFAPFFALAAGWGSIMLWAGRSRGLRLGLVVILLAVVTEGVFRVAALESAAATTTPYYAFIDRVRREIPNGARVLGLHNYWFGLEDFDYRSFAAPLWWSEAHNEPRPLSLDEGLDQIAPDIVLIDSRLREYFAGDTQNGGANEALFDRWLARHRAERVDRIEDPTYGVIEIFRVE
ncbi:MAG TPA: glycosyltransferase family 39 protein [Anaerolineae bacterium]|nr:glycosyltransferase family 39 protein [Anaerolineae bacterium]